MKELFDGGIPPAAAATGVPGAARAQQLEPGVRYVLDCQSLHGIIQYPYSKHKNIQV